jgi:3-methyladenine DNA glycosylase AlkD
MPELHNNCGYPTILVFMLLSASGRLTYFQKMILAYHMDYNEIIASLISQADPVNVTGMSRFGIGSQNTLGISVYVLRKMAHDIKKDHALALRLWESGIHEARLLAGFVDEPAKVTDTQLEQWVSDFDSWDIVDQTAALISLTSYVIPKIYEWSKREEEFVKRTAFALIAELSFYSKKMTDDEFEQFFPLIKYAAIDERNYVKKAVNWALRNIGKRSLPLNQRAIEVAKEIQRLDSRCARWIAADAIRELSGEAVQQRLAKLR